MSRQAGRLQDHGRARGVDQGLDLSVEQPKAIVLVGDERARAPAVEDSLLPFVPPEAEPTELDADRALARPGGPTSTTALNTRRP